MQIHSQDSLRRVHGIDTRNKGGLGLIARFKAWQRRRRERYRAIAKALQSYDELLSMPEHMLRDIGLTRGIVRQERDRLRQTGHLDEDVIRHLN